MSDLACQLIRENLEKYHRGEDARVLDLGNCGMSEIPEEIGGCVWLEELRCGGKISSNFYVINYFNCVNQIRGHFNKITRVSCFLS